MFGHTNKPKPEACGVFACVYPHSDPNKVVKITRDPSDVCPRKSPEVKACQARVRELETMINTLADWGVDWIDIHAGNIGVDSKGRWRVLDMGASRTPLYEDDAPMLEGQKRKRRRR